MERRQQLGRAEARRLQYVMSILSTLPQHRRAGMTRVGRATVRELGMKGAVTVDAEDTVPALRERPHRVQYQTEEEGKEASKVHNAIQCNIGGDEYDNETAPGDVAVVSNLKSRADLNGTFGLIREYVPSKQRWGVRCAGQVLDVAIAAKNLVRVTAKELGGNLRYVLSNIEYDEVSAVLAFLTRHLDFVGGGEEGDEDDSEGSPPRNRTR